MTHTSHTSHPACCKNPSTCTLTYREHLVGFGLSATAVPSRAVTRSKSENDKIIIPDEPTTQTITRERRWARDIDAYRRLHREGLRPPRVDGAAARERMGETRYDIEHRKMKIDYNDPN